MRIISGEYKSIKLNTLDGMTTRPTTDKVKENIFNMISCENLEVLDLFGGSGSLGIESLSRGAKKVTFIDGSSNAIKVIYSNINKLKGLDESRYEIYRNDYLKSLKIFFKKNKKYDLVFLDPPYKKGLLDISLENLAKLKLLNDNSSIVCEYSQDEKINYINDDLVIYKEKKYGSINVTIYKYFGTENNNE